MDTVMVMEVPTEVATEQMKTIKLSFNNCD